MSDYYDTLPIDELRMMRDVVYGLWERTDSRYESSMSAAYWTDYRRMTEALQRRGEIKGESAPPSPSHKESRDE